MCMIPQEREQGYNAIMCCDDYSLDKEDEEEGSFSYTPKLPDSSEYETGESEYGDLDDEEFDIEF